MSCNISIATCTDLLDILRLPANYNYPRSLKRVHVAWHVEEGKS